MTDNTTQLKKSTRVVKWTLTAVTSFLFLVLLAFGTGRSIQWWSATRKYGLDVMAGTIYLSWRPPGWQIEDEKYPPHAGFATATIMGGINRQYWFSYTSIAGLRSVGIPVWVPMVLMGLPAGLLWYCDRAHAASVWRRFKQRATPRRKQRVTLGKSIIGIVVNAAFALIAGSVVWYWLSLPMLSPNSPRVRFLEVMMMLTMILFLLSPALGVFWTWITVRTLNRWRDESPLKRCDTCGYDLTGNTSGWCPECGAGVTDRSESGVESQSV